MENESNPGSVVNVKEYVPETFAWMHYYWFLRTYLNLTSKIVPNTLKKAAQYDGAPKGALGAIMEGGDQDSYCGYGLMAYARGLVHEHFSLKVFWKFSRCQIPRHIFLISTAANPRSVVKNGKRSAPLSKLGAGHGGGFGRGGGGAGFSAGPASSGLP